MSEEPREHPKDPLHGVTLETVVRTLQEKYGWEEMSRRVRVRCFTDNPSIKSSLTFLRKTPWAREKVESWYLWETRRKPSH
ncbi:VF530 family DNA-binding protein [Luteolibacter sp. Populi]|uniref:VF530 family protein n=1 Tax=Luteolibacter sp. Populi TaxID=3230487 RepID=UPI0034657B59